MTKNVKNAGSINMIVLQHSVPYVKQELLILKYNAMYVNGCIEHRVKQSVLLWTHLFKIKIGKALGLKN